MALFKELKITGTLFYTCTIGYFNYLDKYIFENFNSI